MIYRAHCTGPGRMFRVLFMGEGGLVVRGIVYLNPVSSLLLLEVLDQVDFYEILIWMAFTRRLECPAAKYPLNMLLATQLKLFIGPD